MRRIALFLIVWCGGCAGRTNVSFSVRWEQPVADGTAVAEYRIEQIDPWWSKRYIETK